MFFPSAHTTPCHSLSVDESASKRRFSTRFCAGYITLLFATIISHPLDTLRVRLSVKLAFGYIAAPVGSTPSRRCTRMTRPKGRCARSGTFTPRRGSGASTGASASPSSARGRAAPSVRVQMLSLATSLTRDQTSTMPSLLSKCGCRCGPPPSLFHQFMDWWPFRCKALTQSLFIASRQALASSRR